MGDPVQSASATSGDTPGTAPERRRVSVMYLNRKRGPGFFSLERVFEEVRKALPPDIQFDTADCPRPSQGILNRLHNIVWAGRHEGQISHITGDVHYLTYLLRPETTLLTIADCVSLQTQTGLKRWLLWLLWYWLPVRRCSRITVISAFTKSELLRYVRCDPSKIEVVYCPRSADMHPSPRPFNSERPVLLQVGTSANKNLERVADAVRGLSCELRIVGPVAESLRQKLVGAGVYWTNYAGVSDQKLRELYESSDVVLFASLYEGFGLPIIEAQAIGRPVVTSNICSMPEVAGDAACLVDPYQSESIRAGILRVVNDRAYRDTLVRRGFENVRRFDVATIAEKYASLYRSLAHPPATS